MIESKHKKTRGDDGLHLIEIYVDGTYSTMIGVEVEKSGLMVFHIGSHIKVSRFIPTIQSSDTTTKSANVGGEL